MTITHTVERNGIKFRADMSRDGAYCYEQVEAADLATGAGLGVVHSASFPARNLGSTGAHDEYVRVMLSSIVDAYFRIPHGPKNG